MKKLSYLVALSAILMSCSQNEVVKQAPQLNVNQINFSPVIGKQTKAIEANLDALKASGFYAHVYAIPADTKLSDATTETANEYIHEKIIFTTDTWAPEPVTTFYWPSADTELNLFSYAHGNSTSIVSTDPDFETSNFLSLVFTTNAVVADQEDLLVASTLDQVKSLNPNIAISFKHALSQVRFYAKTTDDSYQVIVKEINVLKANSVGSFTFNEDTTVGGWSDINTPADYTLYTDATGVTCGSTLKAIETNATTNYCLMLVPQGTAGDFKFSVKYDILSKSGIVLEKGVTKEAAMNPLVMSKKYAYNLTLPITATPITFSVDVSDWDAKTDVDETLSL